LISHALFNNQFHIGGDKHWLRAELDFHRNLPGNKTFQSYLTGIKMGKTWVKRRCNCHYFFPGYNLFQGIFFLFPSTKQWHM
jgi:hypothetical protein